MLIKNFKICLIVFCAILIPKAGHAQIQCSALFSYRGLDQWTQVQFDSWSENLLNNVRMDYGLGANPKPNDIKTFQLQSLFLTLMMLRSTKIYKDKESSDFSGLGEADLRARLAVVRLLNFWSNQMIAHRELLFWRDQWSAARELWRSSVDFHRAELKRLMTELEARKYQERLESSLLPTSVTGVINNVDTLRHEFTLYSQLKNNIHNSDLKQHIETMVEVYNYLGSQPSLFQLIYMDQPFQSP